MTSVTTPANFTELGLIPPLLARLTELEYQQPTPIQAQAIPSVLAGRDLIAGANTGSGKTATFALPLLQKIQAQQLTLPPQAEKSLASSTKGNYVTGLILVPTRELAKQVADSIKSYAVHFNGKIKTVAVFGGVSANTQMLALRGGSDILVATPGRLLDLISSNAIKLDKVNTLVLDEADRMLSLGFTEELSALLALLPKKKQTLLFSATFPEQVKALTQELLNNPIEIQLQSSDASTLVQRVFTVNKGEKTAVLAHLIQQQQWRQALIFVNAKHHCEHLAEKLAKHGITAAVFHGDKGQGERSRVLDGFKAGEIAVLIATDIAARGLDIEKLPVVINFNLPRSPSDYMHRIGRSGRAGEVGLAISLIDHEDYHHFKVIEKKNKIWLEREQVEGFEADEISDDSILAAEKPMAAPEGSGKKKRKKKPTVNADIWAGYAEDE
ncbi:MULTISPECIES: DEAD/DEAH box helicase [unclassified Colwellia]|uniref:DEAD/DEAH box helicase n=1 Tax=unclassified Colwellia TaxID=196834 RepID=UPI0015F3E377|nr:MULTISPECIES: DEAD/DEAH box helicase [unclassified Colwellia]MBA6225716.1 DEAD/DEAH box helicase [Colwellia sp. MB3u-45]MBA6266964.1 DEAD/DEAH box helicase [Colwellia sp. MB3u-43]MBA6290536.1 DEAD/DEAH box helicase [Colwellia sp. MB3u-4]MBA6295486.1 DEAD/DEAH box helicase [Colwellia sp. MB02u-9]MBA6321876.1 DEAD/DEAH box helicase [Colwellia sp. MB02u-19]